MEIIRNKIEQVRLLLKEIDSEIKEYKKEKIEVKVEYESILRRYKWLSTMYLSESEKKIINDTEKKFWVSYATLCWESRTKAITEARRYLCYKMRNQLWRTFSRIWKVLNRDSSSIIYLLKTCKENVN